MPICKAKGNELEHTILSLAEIYTSELNNTVKGIPGQARPFPLKQLGQQGWNLLAQDLPLPVAVLKESVVCSNSEWMRAFLKSHDIAICPHGKTTMSPQLFELQLQDGAWGITAATPAHLAVYRRFGVQRILYANQLIAPDTIRYVLAELKRDQDFDFYCLVDSTENLTALAEACVQADIGRPLQLLLEIGAPGGRTGVRTMEDAVKLARAVRACRPYVVLRGIEAFEGIFDFFSEEEQRRVSALLDNVIQVATLCVTEQLFGDEEIILTAGGSAFFEQVARRFTTVELGRPAKVVIRSGCYLSHDIGFYGPVYDDMKQHSTELAAIPGDLVPALEVWGYIQSIPEPNLALASIGKRDVSFDIAMPVPTLLHRPGTDVHPHRLSPDFEVTGLNDQHAYIRIPTGADCRVGDLIAFGISHPCTTFDKWQYVFLVDESYNVTGAVRTFF